ncbi:hypothetical protein DFQ28_001603 [Apophysomyces sp. BC1034]|nr:hypothetical protein DFQ30_004208 [Apophysomyces sp. BC1015]KAG0180225.1 hypothetical protein DFQ29_001047 [Apophysomyces sp. BC1021]KAG0190756.1 hypothetical protein DFQ28_001603 [Apophysomyces sp. BC1034]
MFARKRHGHRADFLFKTTTSELSCGEVGRENEGETGKKDQAEGGLKCPKMKDMMYSLQKTYPNVESLVVVEFIIMGLKIRVLVMDRPSTYICRIQGTPPLYFPTTEDTFAIQIGEILCLIIQAKGLIEKTLQATKISRRITDVSFCYPEEDSLPPCPSTPTVSCKRLRTDPNISRDTA